MASVPSPAYHVYTAADARYWQHLHVALHSLLETNRDLPLRVSVLHHDDPAPFLAHLDALRPLHPDFEIAFRRVDPALFAGVPLGEKGAHFTEATYYRLLLGEIVPAGIDRILYLDCDTVVRRSLRPLFEADLGAGAVVGAVPLPGSPAWQWLGLPEGEPYFNAGVLVVDLPRWRAAGVREAAFAFLRDHAAKIRWVDQDVLNVVLSGRWRELGAEWNFQEAHAILWREGKLAVDPALVHYTGNLKPWHYLCDHPFKAEYRRVLRETPYAANLNREPDRTWRNRLVVHLWRRLPGGMKKALKKALGK